MACATGNGTAILLINKLMAERAKGDRIIENGLRAKLMLKGIRVDKFNESTPDDPVVLEKIKNVLTEFGVGA